MNPLDFRDAGTALLLLDCAEGHVEVAHHNLNLALQALQKVVGPPGLGPVSIAGNLVLADVRTTFTSF